MEPSIHRVERPFLRPATRPVAKREQRDEDEHEPFELDRGPNQDKPANHGGAEGPEDQEGSGSRLPVAPLSDDEVGSRLDLSA